MTNTILAMSRRLSVSVASSLLAWLFLVAVAGGASAQDDVEREIDEALSWAQPSTPGCAVAVAQGGERIVHLARGSADLENDKALTPSTRFDAGSLVKQFVAAGVLLLVDDGRCALSDDVREHIPELADLGHVVTVDHLLTHTSGVRDWLALRNMSSEDEDALTLVLRQRGLNFVPGEEWSYSNSGYVLLKELVHRLSGKSFAEFARERLFEPLGMQATVYAEPGDEHEDLAIAYERRGPRWEEAVLGGNERGGGGALLSTVGDLTLWNRALAGERLGAFVGEKLFEPARLLNGRELSYARGLFVEESRGRRVIWHTGSAGAYKSMLGWYPDHELSIAILSNAGESVDRAELVRRILDRLAPVTEPEDSARNAATADFVTGEDLRGKAGLFFSERTGDPLRLLAQRGQLVIAGGPALVPVAEGRLRNTSPMLPFRSGDEFEIQFSSDDAFELLSMEGQVTGYRRAQPDNPTAELREAYVGLYESDELTALLEVESEANGLSIRINDSPPIRVASAELDTFQFRLVLVRFVRDEEDEVVGLDFSNPMLRRVRFTRVGSGEDGG